jgi:hypothetical protein
MDGFDKKLLPFAGTQTRQEERRSKEKQRGLGT